MGSLGANSAKRLEVYMLIDGGELVIAPANCKAAVAGSGIASGYVEWDGKISIEEFITVFEVPNAVMTFLPFEEKFGMTFYSNLENTATDTFGVYSLKSNVTLLGFTDSVKIGEENG